MNEPTFASDAATSMEMEQKSSTKSPLMGLLEWEQTALTGLDASLSDLIQKLGPLLEQPTAEKEPREQKDSHGSEFAKQYQTNIEKIERLSSTVKDLIRRCDV